MHAEHDRRERRRTPWDIGGFDSFDITLQRRMHSSGDSPFPGDGQHLRGPETRWRHGRPPDEPEPDDRQGQRRLCEDKGGGERNLEDYEGDPRPTDGDGDGHTVDMGADESPAFVAQPPIIPPPPPQCSDRVDNDGDGAIDSADPGCLAGPKDNNEGDETPRDLILCGQRTISLVRADVRGSKVVLSGIVATSVAGQKVAAVGPLPRGATAKAAEARLGHAGAPRASSRHA